MTLERQTWFTKPIMIETVSITLENLKEVTEWIYGAEFYEVITDIHSGQSCVRFIRRKADNSPYPGNTILTANISDYIVREDAYVDVYGEQVPVRYYALTEFQLKEFRKENADV